MAHKTHHETTGGAPAKDGAGSAAPHTDAVPPQATQDAILAEAPLKTAGHVGGMDGDAEPLGADAGDAAADAEATAEAAKNAFRDAAEAIKSEAGKIGGEAKEKLRGFAGEGMGRATGALDDLARMMNGAAGDVDARLGEKYGQYARSAAEGVQGFADTLRDKDIDDLVEDVTNFVRKSPAIAIGTAAVVGFALARLLRASTDDAADSAPASDDAA